MDKKIFVVRPVLPPVDRYISYVKQIFENQYLTNQGPFHKEFEAKLAEYIKNDDVTLFCNGHMALECALQSLDLKKGGEVITTPYTFISTTHSIINSGLKPVFCDIKLTDYTIDEEKIETLINENTVAIMPVHVYGYPCNVKRIEEIAKKHNLKVIYDAAHAFGVEVDNKSIFNYGDLSMASFHSTKLFHTIEGGMIVGNNNSYKKRLTIIKNFGIDDSTAEILESGLNAKMTEFSAAMGLSLFPELDSIINRRKEIVELYIKNLDLPGIKIHIPDESIKYNYAYFPILVDKEKFGIDRDELLDYLEKYNIFTRKYFYPLCCDPNYMEFKEEDVKNARYVSNNVLTLPLYPTLENEEVEYICSLIKKIHEEKKAK